MRAAVSAGSLVGLGFALATAATFPAQANDGFQPSLSIKGLIDFRGVVSSSTQSWENGSLGKTRYGGTATGDRRTLGTIGEGSLVLEPHLGWDISGVIQVTAAPEQHVSPDLIEAYLQYKPAPTSPWGVRMRAGLFFPPVSEENTGLAWTSPYTISPSAINTWVGEELRTVGGEMTVFHRGEDLEIALTAAAFTHDDPAGTLLAWRGWTISDRKAGLFDQLNLPALPSIRPGGAVSKQQPYDQPFTEIDGRIGYYAMGKLTLGTRGSVSVMRFDNRGDDRVFDNGQWPWHTTFWNVGVDLDLAGFDLLGQSMSGRTTLLTVLPGGAPLVYADFKSAYGLISRAWGRHRVSFRYDWFKTEGDDTALETDERGHALTFAYIFRPTRHQRITFETLYIDSNHSERIVLGLPVRARETQFQLSYRFSF